MAVGEGGSNLWGLFQVGPAPLSLRDFFLPKSNFRTLIDACIANSRVKTKGLTSRSRKNEHLFTWGWGRSKSLEGWRAGPAPKRRAFSRSIRKTFFGPPYVAAAAWRCSENRNENSGAGFEKMSRNPGRGEGC